MIDFNASITIGNIIEIAVIAGGGLLVLIKQTGVIEQMQKAIEKMQTEISQIGKILIQNAVTDNRLNNLEEEIKLIKRGRGFITEEVSGEYTRHGKVIHK